MRKLVLTALALAAASFAGGPGWTAADKADGGSPEHHAAFEHCAKACGDCQRACDSCATHCARLVADGKKEHLKTLRTCQDCATHCSAAACIVARMGPFADTICKACAEACARCGKQCEQHAEDAH